MKRFDAIVMFVSLWLLVSMVVDVLTRVRANLVGRPNETSTTASPAKASAGEVRMKADSLA